MPQPAIPLELGLLIDTLDREFAALIQGTGTLPDQQRSNFLSKAIAAFVLVKEAGATPEKAVAASVDGGGDHGIDSIFVAPDDALWLVQSKYISGGAGEPILGDVSKFRDGVVDLLRGKYDRFNQGVLAKRVEIESALNQPHRQVRVILAHTGGAISEERRNIFSDLEQTFNSTDPDYLRCYARGLSSLHDFHLDAQSTAPIDEEIELKDFGYIDQPYRGFYGRLSARILAELQQRHGSEIVERNIRRFKGSTAVNKGLLDTLITEAQHFFYYNNGVTFLCNQIQEKHPKDPTRSVGRFSVRGLSVINGAQTLGVIAEQGAEYYETNSAEVLATFVSLESAPEEFGT